MAEYDVNIQLNSFWGADLEAVSTRRYVEAIIDSEVKHYRIPPLSDVMEARLCLGPAYTILPYAGHLALLGGARLRIGTFKTPKRNTVTMGVCS